MDLQSILYSELRDVYGKDADFREDQLKAIISTITNHSTLVVEKTGWGKSLIYFLATKYFRAKGSAPAVVVSPLRSLMRNQKETAQKLNLNAVVFSGELYKNNADFAQFKRELHQDLYDLIFITPEQLSKEDVRNLLISVGKEYSLIVVDEVHCLSEWGHDFRPDFLNIRKFVQNILSVNPNLHLLATTATANDLVIEDLKHQFGRTSETNIIRGPLTRDSIHISVVQNLNFEEKYAWIVEYLKNKTGSGIIYCLTVKDCELLALFLQSNHINAKSYHSGSENREELETQFNENKIRVLVATNALGMGYDKPDIAFVIHFNRPASMLEYYQQIGRAGRGIKDAEAILLTNSEDDSTLQFFINNAFPKVEVLRDLLDFLETVSSVKLNELQEKFNLKKGAIESALKHLESRDLVIKEGSTYSRTANKYDLNSYIEEKNKITENRYHELEIMHDYENFEGCLMEFISKELNDPYSHKCGHCQNCTNRYLSSDVNEDLKNSAYDFVNKSYVKNPALNKIEPRKKYHFKDIKYIINFGFFLCKYNIGLGKLVREGKYIDNHFSEKLVNEMAKMIRFMQNRNDEYSIPRAPIITFVPSLRRPELVKSFAVELANKLGIICVDALEKVSETEEQKKMENSEMQFNNLANAFRIRNESIPEIKDKDVYLIDDMVDSRWTFTICGATLLGCGGVKSVTPLAIADTSNQSE